jgi:ankyrin repeat protein
LDHGADIHSQNDEALYKAAENKHIDVVKLLLDRGANIHVKNNKVLRMALANKHTEVIKLLLNYGANTQGLSLYQCNIIKVYMTELPEVDI